MSEIQDHLEVEIIDENDQAMVKDCFIPRNLSDDLARLVGFGLAYESDWTPDSVELAIWRDGRKIVGE